LSLQFQRPLLLEGVFRHQNEVLRLIPGYDRTLGRIVFLIVLFEREWDELPLYCRMSVVLQQSTLSLSKHAEGNTPGMASSGVLLTAVVLSLRNEDIVAVVICVVLIVAMVASSDCCEGWDHGDGCTDKTC
jgi:hypothetical protein